MYSFFISRTLARDHTLNNFIFVSEEDSFWWIFGRSIIINLQDLSDLKCMEKQYSISNVNIRLAYCILWTVHTSYAFLTLRSAYDCFETKWTCRGKKSSGLLLGAENSREPDLLEESKIGIDQTSAFFLDSWLYSPSHSATTGLQPILRSVKK